MSQGMHLDLSRRPSKDGAGAPEASRDRERKWPGQMALFSAVETPIIPEPLLRRGASTPRVMIREVLLGGREFASVESLLKEANSHVINRRPHQKDH